MTALPSKTQLLDALVDLTQTLKQGQILLKINESEGLELKIDNNGIDINLLDKKLLKTLTQLETSGRETPTLQSLDTLKNLAEQIKQNCSTITISYQGQKLITLGSEAKPTISQLITGTNAIQIENLPLLLKFLSL